MPMLEIDIWRAAQLMIDTHGNQAERQAVLKMEQLQKHGDQGGSAGWKQITTAIIVLCLATPGFAGPKH
jgi:hypothetical protein